MLHAEAARAFRARAKDGEVCLGIHMSSMSPQIVELMGVLGLDFVIVSAEVESLDISRMEEMIRAAQSAGTVPTVKIRRYDPDLVGDAMSAGAPMVMVPHVKTRAMLDEMIRASRFEPFGNRALCPVARYTGYGARPLSESRKTANEDHTIVPIIEDREALEHLDELFSCDDVDIFEFGPFDMSQSLGLARPEAGYDNAETMRAAEQIGKVARKYKKALLAPLWFHPQCDTSAKLVQLQIDRLVSVGINCFYVIEVLVLGKIFRELMPLREARVP